MFPLSNIQMLKLGMPIFDWDKKVNISLLPLNYCIFIIKVVIEYINFSSLTRVKEKLGVSVVS